jgi:hypothetical protein
VASKKQVTIRAMNAVLPLTRCIAP